LYPSYLQALQSQVLTLCYCWLITRKDGVKLGFTDFDQDLTFGGVTYRAYGSFKATNVDSDSSLSTPPMVTLESFFADIAESDILSGQYDGAKCQFFRVNFLDPPNSLGDIPPNYEILIDGFFGKVNWSEQKFTVELAGLPKLLSNQSNWVTSPTCRNQFCDFRCGLNIATYTFPFNVAAVLDRQGFHIPLPHPYPNYYAGGLVTWTTGSNQGLTMGVLSSLDDKIYLVDEMPFDIQIDDNLTVTANCQKGKFDCINLFGNYLNFNGEEMPGDLAYGRSTQ